MENNELKAKDALAEEELNKVSGGQNDGEEPRKHHHPHHKKMCPKCKSENVTRNGDVVTCGDCGYSFELKKPDPSHRTGFAPFDVGAGERDVL